MSEAGEDLVAGRDCDGCTMCCKLLAIDVLNKPRGKWCGHCNARSGCRIYQTRPEPCRNFYCGYRRIAGLDERWKPSHAKFLINYETELKRIVIHVDADRPGAWRQEPFYSTILRWAGTATQDGGMVIVWKGREVAVVLPDRVKELGAIDENDLLVPSQRQVAGRTIWDVTVTKPSV
jgi:hypothetical protein